MHGVLKRIIRGELAFRQTRRREACGMDVIGNWLGLAMPRKITFLNTSHGSSVGKPKRLPCPLPKSIALVP